MSSGKSKNLALPQSRKSIKFRIKSASYQVLDDICTNIEVDNSKDDMQNKLQVESMRPVGGPKQRRASKYQKINSKS